MKILYWFRSDLRTSDNPSLADAMTDATELLSLFIITPKTWKRHDAAAVKVQFILNNLASLSGELQQSHRIPLLIRTVDYFSDCATLLLQLCIEHKIDAVYFNEQYEHDERHRDARVKKLLSEHQILVKTTHDQCVLAPGEVLSQKSEPFKVFTPFKKVWLETAWKKQAFLPHKKIPKKSHSVIKPDTVPNVLADFNSKIDLTQWAPGEHAAQKKLLAFCKQSLKDYKNDRDIPSLKGTSQLSPYLAQGVISPRQCIAGMMQALGTDDFRSIQADPGAATWLSELIWREFYKHIAYFFPTVCRHQPFKLQTKKLPWRKDRALFQAWCDGKTGFPLVDAAMRQLNQTGWMHNRLRMVTAMFLTKTLFIDWRWGEKYFMEHLIDGDFSANNGGWQWSASTGTDSVPYFRIFNPTTQSERFDPQGTFIRQYCPELKNIDTKKIHAPGDHYIAPIVNYAEMRALVIGAFKSINQISPFPLGNKN